MTINFSVLYVCNNLKYQLKLTVHIHLPFVSASLKPPPHLTGLIFDYVLVAVGPLPSRVLIKTLIRLIKFVEKFIKFSYYKVMPMHPLCLKRYLYN